MNDVSTDYPPTDALNARHTPLSEPAHAITIDQGPVDRRDVAQQQNKPRPSTPEPAPAAPVRGRIDIADEVVEKIAALAAFDVDGVADLGGDIARGLETMRERMGIGQKRGNQGVAAEITGDEATIDITVVVEYGHVVMDVARRVQANVAEQTDRMLGLRVSEVNVTVDDVRTTTGSEPAADPDIAVRADV